MCHLYFERRKLEDMARDFGYDKCLYYVESNDSEGKITTSQIKKACEIMHYCSKAYFFEEKADGSFEKIAEYNDKVLHILNDNLCSDSWIFEFTRTLIEEYWIDCVKFRHKSYRQGLCKRINSNMSI